jgi:hypothetical protein
VTSYLFPFQVYSRHPCLHGGLPFGEDGWAGLINLQLGYQMRQNWHTSVDTFTPDRFFPPLVAVDR